VSQALLLFAVGTTFLIPQFYSAVDSRVGTANISRVISHVFIVVACWRALAVLYYIADDRPQRRIRRTGYIAAGTVALLLVTFALSSGNVEEPVAFTSLYSHSPSIIVYRCVFLSYVGLLLANLLILCIRSGRLSTSRPSLHLGLYVSAVGSLAGLGYVLHGLLYLTDQQLHFGYGVPEPLASTILGAISVSLVAIGATMPAWGPRLGIATLYDRFAQYRSCRRLYPLWRDLCRAAPDVALDRVPGPVADSLIFEDLRFRLYRRVVEIRDGRLALWHNVPDGAHELALRRASQVGIGGQKLDATVEAACLHAALAAIPGLRARATPPPPIQSANLADEVAFLELVAAAYQRSPIPPAVLSDLSNERILR
jgi:hypothetical protein